MKYQNSRGGRIVLHDIKAPATNDWANHIAALEAALALERKVNDSLIAIHKTSDEKNDYHLSDFLESEFLDEQVQSINEISKLITKAKLCGIGLGTFQFDKLEIGSDWFLIFVTMIRGLKIIMYTVVCIRI